MIRTALMVLALLSACSTAQATTTHTDTPTAATASCTVLDGKADRRCTPGVVNPLVTQANIATTVCRKGWTATIRPPVSYTAPLKRRDMALYGQTGPASALELDHLIPLEAGGSPTDPKNLWTEPRTGPHPAAEKDAAENATRKAICNGRLTLAEGQAEIVKRWTH